MNEEVNNKLTKIELDRIEKNKQRALTLKKGHVISHPYSRGDVTKLDKATAKIGNTRYKDTGAGFLLEEEETKQSEATVSVQNIPPIFEPDRPTCEECKKVFASSWLFDTFYYKVCDECKNPETHKLITKTDAINNFLLKDCDLSKRKPVLKFVKRINPHNSHWGDMKLYLQIQVEQKALEIWGSEENLRKELEAREEKRIEAKTKKYQKQMKQLRMNMRSSLYNKTSAASHTHKFGPESYNEDDDTYSHICVTCKFEETFEKM